MSVYQMISDVHKGQALTQNMLADIADYGIITYRDKTNDVFFNNLFNFLSELLLQ